VTYVTFEDVQARYEQDIPAEQVEYVDALIGEAETLLTARVPGLADRITAGSIDVEVVGVVVKRAVLRVLRNPDGYTSEQAGDYSYRVSAAVASGHLDYTPADLALVQGESVRARVPRMIGVRPPSPHQIPESA
jgi:hypothetical protein